MFIKATRFRPAQEEDSGEDCLAQTLPRAIFRPIGDAIEEAGAVGIIYLGAEVDLEWLKRVAPDLPTIQRGLEEAFRGHCSPDVRREIEQMVLVGDELKRFQADGHLPFLQLERIVFDPGRDRVLFEGRCDIDPDLDEHGVSIKYQAEEWVLEHACDWDEEEEDWDPDFLNRAFAEQSANHDHFMGTWGRPREDDDTIEITKNKLIFRSWKKTKERRLEVLRVSPSHLMMKIHYPEGPGIQVAELSNDRFRYCDSDGTPFGHWKRVQPVQRSLWDFGREDARAHHLQFYELAIEAQDVPEVLDQVLERLGLEDSELEGPFDFDSFEKLYRPPLPFEECRPWKEGMQVRRLKIDEAEVQYIPNNRSIVLRIDGEFGSRQSGIAQSDLKEKLTKLEKADIVVREL